MTGIFLILPVSRRITFYGMSKLSRTYKEAGETLTTRKTLVKGIIISETKIKVITKNVVPRFRPCRH